MINFLHHLNSFIDSNILGWEVVICQVCNRYEDDCKAPCPVALAVSLRDALRASNAKLEPSWCVLCAGFPQTPTCPECKGAVSRVR